MTLNSVGVLPCRHSFAGRAVYVVGVVGPSRAVVDVEPQQLLAGSTATLTCTVDNANPAPRVTWWTTSHDGRLEALLDAVAVRESRTAAEHGGSVVVSSVDLLLNADDDRKIVMCLANGTDTATNQVQLHVGCKSLHALSRSAQLLIRN